MNLGSARRFLQILLPVTLLITSCASGASAAGTTGDASGSAVNTENTQSAEEQEQDPSAEIKSEDGAATNSAATANAATAESSTTTPSTVSERHDDVDYGTLDADVEYYSETAGDVKYCNVLLPPGYDESQQYPVLYMYHGFGGRYDSHVHEGSILQTLYGNMLSEGLTVPMIIVGADMYTDILTDKDDKSDAELRPCYDKGIDDLAFDLMPFIESRYSVKTGRRNTAVTGVSQGATEALAAGFKWQAKIGFIGSFAPCTGVIPTPFGSHSFWSWPILDDLTIESPDTVPYYIYLTVGSEDPWCIKSTQYYGEVMDKKGIPNQNDLVEGYDHGNEMWELGHYNFLQKIFLD